MRQTLVMSLAVGFAALASWFFWISPNEKNNNEMLRSLFGMAPKVDLPQLLQQGATVLDVRTPAEFARGHVAGSINIPLDQVLRNLHQLPKDRPVITCCQSGGRSAQAASVLKDHGFEAHNGGPWTQVQANLKK